MITNLSFWAQALDNSSPDHFRANGLDLLAEDEIGHQSVVSNMSRVGKVGRCIFDKHWVRLTVDGHHFNIEIPCVERDNVGRRSSIACYGSYDGTTGEALAKSVIVGINDFANKIDRSLRPEHLELVGEQLKNLKKKTSSGQPVLIAVALIAVITIAYSLVRRGGF